MPKKKKLFIGVIVLILFAIVWYFGINPANDLKNRDIKEVGIYSLKIRPSLFEMGYKEKDLITPSGMSPEYNGIFSGEAVEQIIDALRKPAHSYYTFENPKDEDKLYSINVKFSKEEGYTFITRNLEEEIQGRFWGYRYKELQSEGKEEWFIYINPKLGEVLSKLRYQ